MNVRKILILGATGMLGHSLMISLSKVDHFDVWGTCRIQPNSSLGFPEHLSNKLIALGEINMNTKELEKLIEELMPEVIINCIGAIKQKSNEFQMSDFIFLNALFPHLLLNKCKQENIRLIHISTDCVFNGEIGNYYEGSQMSATDLYGMSKYLGEFSCAESLTIRISIVGHELENNKSLLNWFLSQNNSVQGYSNVKYNGLTTTEVGKILEVYILPNASLTGLIHISSSYTISKYELLLLVAKIYNKKIQIVKNSEKVENKTLDHSKFKAITGYISPTWEEMVKELKNQFEYINYRVKNNTNV